MVTTTAILTRLNVFTGVGVGVGVTLMVVSVVGVGVDLVVVVNVGEGLGAPLKPLKYGTSHCMPFAGLCCPLKSVKPLGFPISGIGGATAQLVFFCPLAESYIWLQPGSEGTTVGRVYRQPRFARFRLDFRVLV
jgi:hypothetical protein